jgi:hypothetical protein
MSARGRIAIGAVITLASLGASVSPALAKAHHGHKHGHGRRQVHHAVARHGHSHHSTAVYNSEYCPALRRLAAHSGDLAALRRYHACLARQSGY